jgi:hypothetical protein
VRDFMNGAPWFDTTIDRFGGAYPLHSHWSRLIDLPVAALISFFANFLEPGTAESAARTVWPLLVFACLLSLLARSAEVRGGRAAGFAALVLAVLCLSGTMQFAPGRIDHHNVMILSAAAGVLLLAHSFVKPKWGWGAGSLLALGTAVGYEGLILTVITLGVAALMAVLTGAGRSGVRRAALSFASTLTLAFFATTDIERWRYVTCDALGLNLVLMASASSIGLAAVLHMRPRRSLEVRLAALAATGITALAMYAVVEPQCLKGPFGGLDQRLWSIWLDRVMETHGIGWLAASLPMVAGVYLTHVVLGTVAGVSVWRQDRDWGAFFFAIVLGLWSLASLWQAKLMPYAAFLAVPAIAVAIARLPEWGTLSAGFMRMSGLALGNQFAMLAMGALIFGSPEPSARAAADGMRVRRACLQASSIAPLAHLPKGLVAAPVDLGPFIAVNTQLDVLAAPYHRLDRQIIEVHDIFAAEPDEAKRRLARAGVSYVVICGGGSLPEVDTNINSLDTLLRTGQKLPFLERVTLSGASPLEVWRVR